MIIPHKAVAKTNFGGGLKFEPSLRLFLEVYLKNKILN